MWERDKTLLSKKKNEYSRGIGAVEVLIAIALLITIILFSLSLLRQTKNQSAEIEKAINITDLEKSIAAHIFSEYGCRQLQGLPVGSQFSIKKTVHDFDEKTGTLNTLLGEEIFSAGMVINDVTIEDMILSSISKLTSASDSAIATLMLNFSFISPGKKREKHFYAKEILVPVGLEDGLVSDCQLDKKVMYEYLVNRLCTEPFGEKMSGLNCDEAIIQIEMRIKESLCADITGSVDNFDYEKGFCNFAGTYANKTCPPGKGVFGFNNNGDLLCR